jgi:hypothetical protein
MLEFCSTLQKFITPMLPTRHLSKRSRFSNICVLPQYHSIKLTPSRASRILSHCVVYLIVPWTANQIFRRRYHLTEDEVQMKNKKSLTISPPSCNPRVFKNEDVMGLRFPCLIPCSVDSPLHLRYTYIFIFIIIK